ncbi:MAG: type II secretion system F family protein [Chloroflexi bacterium]|nr:type II secretion system F family protein [Chloroflexota bacterium]
MAILLAYPIFLVFIAGFGAGVFVLGSGQSLGRRRPDLATRLRRLDPNQSAGFDTYDPPASDVLALFRPLLSDAVAFVGRLAALLGARPDEQLRQLELVNADVDASGWYRQKILVAAIYLGLAFGLNLLATLGGAWHGGLWPWWVWLGVAFVGFVAPDRSLRQRAAQQRALLTVELATLADLLASAAALGLGLQQAAPAVAPYLHGPLARLWRQLSRRLGQNTAYAEALAELARYAPTPEVESLVRQLVTGHREGIAVAEGLRQLAATLRERRVQEIQAAGNRASARMFLPVLFGMLLPILALVLAPVVASLMDVLKVN